MLKAGTLKNLALTFGQEVVVDSTFSFKRYYIPVNIEQHDKWVMECNRLAAAGMLKPDTENNVCPETYMCWHGYLGTKFERISIIMFSNEIAVTYRTKSVLDRM
jgi:hypothetical protein